MVPKQMGAAQFSTTSLAHQSASISAACGVDLSPLDATFLAKSLNARIAATSSATSAEYLAILGSRSAEVEELVRSLQVGYSEFFRAPLTFALLGHSVLPAILRHKAGTDGSEIRIWSAGCSAGQEAYSIAIELLELAESLGCEIPFRVIASDVSESALATAREGLYTEAEVGNVRLRRLKRWFSAEGSSYRVVPELRRAVDFSAYDLLDDNSSCPPASIFGGFDIVLCCNMLIYYMPEAQLSILRKVHGCLRPGAYLVTGEAERSTVRCMGGFRSVVPVAPVFRKLDLKDDR